MGAGASAQRTREVCDAAYLADDPSLRIYHLGKSGPYLVRVRGHNTLPAGQLVAR